jgi:hypothetical protein
LRAIQAILERREEITMTEIQPTTEQKQPSKRLSVYLLVLLVAIVVVVATYQTGERRSERLVPETLGELQLGELLSGAAAREMINHLHAKGVTPETNEIGFYHGTGGKATLYVSVYSTREAATEAETRMAERIQAGNPIFGEYTERRIGDQVVHRCYGMGQEHYFFSVAANLYWLGVDTQLAEQTLNELLKSVEQ